jgi:UDP-N-acetylmuramoyl-tripeptide--D-alanyl-D-alanine ligase
LFALGELSIAAVAPFGAAARHFESMESLQAAVIAELPTTVSVLVKGSRFMKMEQVVAAVSAHLPPDKETTRMSVPLTAGSTPCC